MKIDADFHQMLKLTVEGLRQDRAPWWSFWRELADYYLPQRYVYLLSSTERRGRTAKNPFILDGTGTIAARTLASGMMNGITSPSRPWIRLNIKGMRDELPQDARVWLDEVTARMLLAMAETNFYNALAIMYLDLCVFGSSACFIYEDYEDVFRCYNSPLGEFYLGQSDRQVVNFVAREFSYKVHQVVEWWGLDNCTDSTKEKWRQGGAQRHEDVAIVHLIQPNMDDKGKMKGKWAFREYYWEQSAENGQVLANNGYREVPGIFPRWELTSNDSYGSCPAMDALGDVIQLQHETKKKAQALDKMVSPPIIADIELQHRPTGLLPNGITFISGLKNGGVGAKPVYQINMPINELSVDIAQVSQRIKETFHNDLFRMISNLDTVRSATEIDARREEKLVLLGPVLERFENEALDPAINRIYGIMERAGLIPEPPPSVAGMELEIQYISVLTAAQTAVSTVPMERWVGLIGNLAAVVPQVLNVPDWDALVRDYGKQLGVPAKLALSPEQSKALTEAQHSQMQQQAQMQQGTALVQGAKTLSETEVGGGANALQRILQ
jgi:hypothetical protein